MKRLKRTLLAAALVGAVSFTAAGQSVTTAYAHGHHGGGHCGGRSTNYYYCGGHAAHTHDGGVCPYAAYVSKSTIRSVQRTLNRSGYNCGTADGVMGAKTKRALKRYQRDNGLTADGAIGQQTLTALGLAG